MSWLGCDSTGVASIQAKETRSPQEPGQSWAGSESALCGPLIAQPSALLTLTGFRTALALGLVLGLWAC